MKKLLVPIAMCLAVPLFTACGGGSDTTDTGGWPPQAGTGGPGQQQPQAGIGEQPQAGSGEQPQAGIGEQPQAGSGDLSPTAQCLQTAQDENRYAGRETCVDCGCENCTQQLADCYNSDDAVRNQRCIAVVECGQMNGCRGSECYCGPGVDAIACAIGAQGACVTEIHAASGASDAAGVAMVRDSGDLTNPLVLANRVGACTRGDPGNEGLPPLIASTPPVTGNCETECQ